MNEKNVRSIPELFGSIRYSARLNDATASAGTGLTHGSSA